MSDFSDYKDNTKDKLGQKDAATAKEEDRKGPNRVSLEDIIGDIPSLQYSLGEAYLSGSYLKVWLKNTGTGRISVADLNKANFFGGSETVYTIYSRVDSAPSNYQWSYSILSGDTAYLNTGDTLEITAKGGFPTASSGDYAYVSFVLPNGVRVSGTFAPNV